MNDNDNAMVSADFTVDDGVSYTLTLHDNGGTVGYVLRMHGTDGTRVIFDGDGFRPSSCHPIDRPDAIIGLLGFLSLCDGDIDSDYFAGYTPEQLEWRDGYAESLAMVVCDCTDEEGSGAIDLDRFNVTIGLTYH